MPQSLLHSFACTQGSKANYKAEADVEQSIIEQKPPSNESQ